MNNRSELPGETSWCSPVSQDFLGLASGPGLSTNVSYSKYIDIVLSFLADFPES